MFFVNFITNSAIVKLESILFSLNCSNPVSCILQETGKPSAKRLKSAFELNSGEIISFTFLTLAYKTNQKQQNYKPNL